ncbi:hypothetical protein CAEBREN_05951 [Caenorhabditis brenneri]|uniref:Uncharacterized protein n=1 Tax=Caenorhabditis brenneri TaxID=135651 RepID=G0MVS3_CAEBE|nr:hypothetical protein CAEBREN_05951 [Caenorhabditis brenneri]
MSRGLLGATMYIEKRLQAAEPTVPWSREEQKRVTEYLADFRKFKNGGKRKNGSGEEPKLKDQLDDEIEASARLLVEFAGFHEIDETALAKLKNVYHNRLLTMVRQFAAAENRRKDGIDMPFKSPLEWTLKLNGVRNSVIEIKEWYDVTYRERYRQLKEQLRYDERLLANGEEKKKTI